MARSTLIPGQFPAGGGSKARVRAVETLRSVIRFRELELSPVARRLSRAANVDDLRRMARRRLPGGVFDYIDGGAEDELTLRRNSGSFREIEFRPRVLVDVSAIDTSTTLLGLRLPLPLYLGPTGFTRIVTPRGELDVAEAAGRAGLPYTLSTLGTRTIEEVAAVGTGPKWFQVYVWRDRGLVKEMINRAAASGYQALMLTVDTVLQGRRERDLRRGFALPPKIGPETIVDGALHPAWTWSLVRSGPITFANLTGSSVPDGSTAVRLADLIGSQFDPALSWRDLDWLRSVWDGPIVLKGVQCVEDAVLAADAGVEAISLSNHGGRQLDGAPPAVELVAPVADAVGDRVAVVCDGGIRRGSDIVKALALGARACSIGRAYLYGLAAGGPRGVDHVLAMLAHGVRQTMGLVGARSVGELTRNLVRFRAEGGRP
jgi:L-lactate dehydrogenase (cytochrome)